MKKVSVIVPAYNSQQFIAETLDSLLSQTLKDIEIIVVNDGSTDSTKEIAERYKKENENVSVYTIENNGVSNARNFGLSKAEGKYVVFCDADDYFSEGSLEAFYTAAEETGADAVIGRLRTFDENGGGSFSEYADILAQMKSIDTFDEKLLMNFLVGNKCYNRQSLLKSGVLFPKFDYCEEGAFFMSFVYSGARLTGAWNSISYYRRHTPKQGLSVSQTVNSRLFKSFTNALNFIYEKADAATVGLDKRDDYLQKVIYKHAFVLLSQFYRLMWHGDDECVKLCADEFSRLKAKMTEETYNRLCQTQKDLPLSDLPQTKLQAAERANVTVIIKENASGNAEEFLASLYGQTCPLFEVIVPEKLYKELPEEYKSFCNLKEVSANGYLKNAKKQANGQYTLVVSKLTAQAQGTLKNVYRLPLPEKVISLFFGQIVKVLNFVLRKRNMK